MALGNAIKELRQVRDWTQEELAQASGIPQATISRLERSINDNPTRETFEKLARAFGITVLELYIEAGLAPPPNALASLTDAGVPDYEVVELTRIWTELLPEDRETALTILRSLWERRKQRAHDRSHLPPKEQHLAV